MTNLQGIFKERGTCTTKRESLNLQLKTSLLYRGIANNSDFYYLFFVYEIGLVLFRAILADANPQTS